MESTFFAFFASFHMEKYMKRMIASRENSR
jgi:hypothetical protein